MKKTFLVTTFLISIIFISCTPTISITSPPTNSIPSSTSTSIPPTSTSTPTPTFIPTPTPVPFGGGGTIYLQLPQFAVPKEWRNNGNSRFFTTTSDGSNIIPLDKYENIYSISPDRKQMFVRMNGELALVNTDGTKDIILPVNEKYLAPGATMRNNMFNLYAHSILWLANGKIVFLASNDTRGFETRSIYLIDSDGSNIKRLEQLNSFMDSTRDGAISKLLFVSPDNTILYWVDGYICSERGVCGEKYYSSKLDDSETIPIWENIKNAGDRFYPSPSGKYFIFFSSENEKRVCKLSTITGNILSDVGTYGYTFCNRGVTWSPTEDKFIEKGWTGYRLDYAIRSIDASGKNTRQKLNSNATTCSTADWMPDGKNVFLTNCIKNSNWLNDWGVFDFNDQFIGQRLVSISTGNVTEYPSFGFCDYTLSPDSKWVIFYRCLDASKDLMPSHLLNLETNETLQIFEQFTSDNADIPTSTYIERSPWFVYWTP